MSEKNGFEILKIEKIVPSKDNPRKEFDKKGIESLANSIKECGLLEPIIVKKNLDGKLEIITGERRLKAVKSLGETDISARIIEMTDEEAAAARLIENLQRAAN